jgi:hypothetical protein
MTFEARPLAGEGEKFLRGGFPPLFNYLPLSF